MIHPFHWWQRRKLFHKKHPMPVHPAPTSISTPLGHVPFRVVHLDASLEKGRMRAEQVKCYSPRVMEVERD